MECAGSPIHPAVRKEMEALGELRKKLDYSFSAEPNAETHPYNAVKRLHELMYALKKVEKNKEEEELMRLRENALDDAYKFRQYFEEYRKSLKSSKKTENIDELAGCKRALSYSLKQYLERLESKYSSCYHPIAH
jgi:hypothetical protein